MSRAWVAVVLCGGLAAQDGARSYAARCAGCHGSDGAGGERGPSLVDGRGSRFKTASSLQTVIRDGVPEGGMPGFRLSNAELGAIAGFVLALREPAAKNPVAGDAAAGERSYRARCAECHRNGPDLSNLANDRSVAQIRRALLKPETLNLPGYRPVQVELRDGRKLSGAAKNESNYDLQLRASDGVLHLLDASQIAKVTHPGGSLMPAIGSADPELPNLLAYLTRLTGARAVASGGRDDSRLVALKGADWPTYNGNIGGNRYSELLGIDTDNVSRLAPVWMFPVPGARRLEVTPVVVDGIMYVTSGNQAIALDARTGRQIWRYSRPLTPGVIGDAAGAINRGVAVLDTGLFMVTDNAHLIALDRFTGDLLWDTEMADYRKHYGATSAPLVVGDLVLSGTSGGDEGARGFIDAYRAATGERVWRFWTMPGKPGDPGSETWVGRAMDHGCAAAWLTGTYDAAAGLIYWPTGNPCPDYNGDERKGDNLYSSSVVALEPATGRLRWYYQFTPHDLHDWDAAQPPVAVDARYKGRERKLLLQANRNGFFYVLDRTTGELLSGTPFVEKLTWASGIGADGRPKLLPGADPTPQGTRVCPAVEGATNWMSTAYSPRTRLYYVQALESCNIYTKSAAWWKPGESFYGGGARRIPGEPGRKVLRALDIETGKIGWEVPQTGSADSWGGVLATAGGLVFFGDDSGAFAAVAADTGKPLWHFHTSTVWKASPMTYAVDGHQFVAVAAGGNVIAFGLR